MSQRRILTTPSKYIQGPGVMDDLGELVKSMGNTFVFLAEDFIFDLKKDAIAKSFQAHDLQYRHVSFQGECTRREINRVADLCDAEGADVLIGFGGGKVLDTGKYAAYLQGIPYISVPSVSSTDAPSTSVVVIYTETGEVEISTNVPESPRMVIVDSQIIAGAPLRLFVAGMGDTLSTYFEARTAYEMGCQNILGGDITVSAMILAKASYDALLEDGIQGKKDLDEKRLTPAVERVIEAETLLSCIGFESGALSAAHGIHNALKNLPETHKALHGELVAFGTLAQLAIEDRGNGDLERVLQFCHDAGLPVTLAELGIVEQVEEKIRQVSVDAMNQPPKYHMPPNAGPDVIYRAIARVDSMGKEVKG